MLTLIVNNALETLHLSSLDAEFVSVINLKESLVKAEQLPGLAVNFQFLPHWFKSTFWKKK